MKKVLVPLSVYESDNLFYQSNIARKTYVERLVSLNVLPVFVSLSFTPKMINSIVASCNGLLLMGGADINPKLYNQRKHNKTKLIDSVQDAFESQILKKFLKSKKPVLGICRGCQLINVTLGGTLVQDIPEKYGCVHSPSEYKELGSIKTNINIEDNTLLSRVTKLRRAIVNCGHHQSIDVLGKDLIASATDSVGIVEAIELYDSSHFCIGIQSHIETQNTVFSNSIFQSYTGSL